MQKMTVFLLGAFGLFMDILVASPTVEIKNVSQRWPWNNKIDITYKVSGGQDVSKGAAGFRKLIFTATIDGVEYTIDGVHDVGANASDGEHTVTWTSAPSGARTKNCSMRAALYPASAPSGDDYMIVNLETKKVSFEGLLASQEDSNARYSDGWYKTTNMVFRKVAAGGTYPVGDTATGLSNNSPTNWVTDRTYYIGIYPVTQWQYNKVYGSNPSRYQNEAAGNNCNYRPVDYVTWNNLRLETTRPDEEIPAVDDNTGTFIQRLNYITGNRYRIDLPTELMWEIAAKAGKATPYFWGIDANLGSEYAVYGVEMPVEVGSRKANAWGIYDVVGNVYEWCRDDVGVEQLKNAPSPWIAASTGAVNRRTRGGRQFSEGWHQLLFRTSYREQAASNKYASYLGFRLAWIVK